MHRCLHLAVCSWLNTLARALRERREPRQRPHQKGAKIGVTAQCTHLLSSQSPEVRDATVADNNPVAREKIILQKDQALILDWVLTSQEPGDAISRK